MGTLRSLLELYGWLDEVAIQAEDPRITTTVEAVLPGASTHRGWYRELESFFFTHTPGGPRGGPGQAPNASNALSMLASEKLTIPQRSRLFYWLLAFNRVQQALAAVTPSAALPQMQDESLRLRLSLQAWSLVGPQEGEPKADLVAEFAKGFLDEISNVFRDRDSYAEARDLARQRGVLDKKVADVPLCQAAIVTVGGVQSVVVDTHCKSAEITLDNLKKVVNPFNWHDNYPDFFCDMGECPPPRTDGWGRVLETVSFCGEDSVLELRTALKYYPSAPSETPTEARLNYDLNDPGHPSPGDGQVTVDRGFINMWSTGSNSTKPGVRVRTRKVVHIKELSPYAQKMLVCITGYGTASMEFLFGPAQSPSPEAKAFDYLGTPPPTNQQPEPTERTGYITQAAVELWVRYVEDLTNRNIELSEKWMAGKLNFTDLATYSKEVTGRLASAPWEFLQAMIEPGFLDSKSKDPSRGGTK